MDETPTPNADWAFPVDTTIPAGSFVAVVVCSRENVAGDILGTDFGFTGLTDDQGNTYTLYQQETQTNELTVVGIYTGTLSTELAAGEDMTVSINNLGNFANHAVVLVFDSQTATAAFSSSQGSGAVSETLTATDNSVTVHAVSSSSVTDFGTHDQILEHMIILC